MRKMFLGALLFLTLLAINCEKSGYKDGVYTGRSGEDDTGSWGEVRIVVESGKVSDCEFITRQKDGAAKDENYGKINGEISNRAYYDKAQLAVEAMKKYAADYARTGSLKGIEAVSGATIAYNQFLEAAADALETAK